MNLFKSEVRYCNPFPNARATNNNEYRPVADTAGGGEGQPPLPYKPMSGRLTSCSRRKDKRIMVSSHKELNVANA